MGFKHSEDRNMLDGVITAALPIDCGPPWLCSKNLMGETAEIPPKPSFAAFERERGQAVWTKGIAPGQLAMKEPVGTFGHSALGTVSPGLFLTWHL